MDELPVYNLVSGGDITIAAYIKRKYRPDYICQVCLYNMFRIAIDGDFNHIINLLYKANLKLVELRSDKETFCIFLYRIKTFFFLWLCILPQKFSQKLVVKQSFQIVLITNFTISYSNPTDRNTTVIVFRTMARPRSKPRTRQWKPSV